jgi:Fic family protein
MTNIDTAVALKKELDALRPLTPKQESKIWQKFRFDWNYHSNNIEGNSLTFGETKSLLLHNITAQGKPLKDHIEITGHNEAIDALTNFTKGSEPLSESFVRNLHVLILRERYQSHAVTPDGVPTRKWIEVGQYKTSPNHVRTVTGEIFRFAEPIDVPNKMRELVTFSNENAVASDAAQIVAAAKVHYDFVLIHPFDDGNGRMARLMMNLLLIKHGFPPAIIKTQDKENYFAALRQADGGQIAVFAEYIAGCVCASLKIMLAGARGESIEEPDEQDRQIKMLERLLDEKVGKLAVVRAEERMAQLFARSFAPLARALEVAARKFESMYVELQTNVCRNNTSYGAEGIESSLTRVGNNIDAGTTSFMFMAQFSNLKFQGADQFSHMWQVRYELHPASYEITTNLGNFPLHKTYDEQISETEALALTKHLTRLHIQAIEQAAGVSLSKL